MTNFQLSFRGVRSSKFRHVYGSPAKKEQCYENITITKNAHDSHFCAVNPKFVAVVTEVAGGGAFLVLPVDRVGRLDFNASRVTGHTGPVLDIKWNPFNDNIIASSSDDCTVKLWCIPDGGLSTNLNDCLIDLRGHKRRVGYIEWHPTAENIIVSAGFDYMIIVWNINRGETVNIIDCHPDIIYSMSFNRDGSLLATTCKDKKLRVIEPRSGTVISEGCCHSGTKASKVVFLGDSKRLFTTGFSRHSDRQYAVWDQSQLSKPLRMEAIDSSSGILFPYYDHDTKIVFLAGKGDGNIRYYEIVEEAPWVHYLHQYLSGSPQRGLGFMPKRGLHVIQCEVFRFYKLHATKGMCEPISMVVPRKSDQFQDDLFPDTVAPTPTMTAEEWINGVNKGPILISLKTGVIVRTHKPVIYKPGDLRTSDRNNERKFAFLSQETVADYRSVEGMKPNVTAPMTSSNQADCPLPESSKPIELRQTAETKSRSEASGKRHTINDIIRYLERQSSGDGNKEKDSNREDKCWKTSCNIETREIQPKWDGYTGQFQLRRAYNEKCEEVNGLKRQLVMKEKRIRELEEEVLKLSTPTRIV